MNFFKKNLLTTFAGLVSMAWIFFTACTTPPDYPVEPYIEYIGITKDTLRRGAMKEDTTFVIFSFTDGDGDIGSKDTVDLFIKDLRTGTFINSLQIPFVPVLGASNGIRGEITCRIFTTCCVFPPALGLDPCFEESPDYRYDKVIYEIFIRDRAGHKSNTILTEPIYIRCFK